MFVKSMPKSTDSQNGCGVEDERNEFSRDGREKDSRAAEEQDPIPRTGNPGRTGGNRELGARRLNREPVLRKSQLFGDR